jgi:hypothetical protein
VPFNFCMYVVSLSQAGGIDDLELCLIGRVSFLRDTIELIMGVTL